MGYDVFSSDELVVGGVGGGDLGGPLRSSFSGFRGTRKPIIMATTNASAIQSIFRLPSGYEQHDAGHGDHDEHVAEGSDKKARSIGGGHIERSHVSLGGRTKQAAQSLQATLARAEKHPLRAICRSSAYDELPTRSRARLVQLQF